MQCSQDSRDKSRNVMAQPTDVLAPSTQHNNSTAVTSSRTHTADSANTIRLLPFGPSPTDLYTTPNDP